MACGELKSIEGPISKSLQFQMISLSDMKNGKILLPFKYRRDKPSAAINFRQNCETVLRRLEDFPESGRIIPEFPELPFREVIISPYRFFYKIKSDVVWIVAVWHGAQLPNQPRH